MQSAEGSVLSVTSDRQWRQKNTRRLSANILGLFSASGPICNIMPACAQYGYELRPTTSHKRFFNVFRNVLSKYKDDQRKKSASPEQNRSPNNCLGTL